MNMSLHTFSTRTSLLLACALPLILSSGCFSGFDAPACNELADCPLWAKACHSGYCISDDPQAPRNQEGDVEIMDMQPDPQPTPCTNMEDPNGCDRWSVQMGGTPLGQPAILNQTIYTTTLKEEGHFLQAFPLQEGILSWERPLELEAPSCLLISEEAQMVVTGTDGVCWFAQDEEESECWQTDEIIVGCPTALPDGGILVGVKTEDGVGELVLLKGGIESWRQPLLSLPTTSPIQAGSSVVIPLNNQFIQRLSSEDGTPLEIIPFPGVLMGNLVGDENNLWFLTKSTLSPALYLLHRASMTEEGASSELSLPFVPTNLLLLSSASTALLPGVNGKLYEVSVSSSSEDSSLTDIAIGGNLSNALIADDESRLVLDAQTGTLTSFLEDGDLQWSTALGEMAGLGQAWITLSEGWFVVTTQEGILHALEVPLITGPSITAPWPMLRKNAQNVGG